MLSNHWKGPRFCWQPHFRYSPDKIFVSHVTTLHNIPLEFVSTSSITPEKADSHSLLLQFRLESFVGILYSSPFSVSKWIDPVMKLSLLGELKDQCVKAKLTRISNCISQGLDRAVSYFLPLMEYCAPRTRTIYSREHKVTEKLISWRCISVMGYCVYLAVLIYQLKVFSISYWAVSSRKHSFMICFI